MNIWYLSAYDQPRGQSTRTYDFSKELVKLGHRVTFFTNNYCHFTHQDKRSGVESYSEELIDGIQVVWLKTFKYKGNGFGRALNMLDNAKQIYFVSKKISFLPDVIIAPSVPLLTGYVGFLLSKRYKVPFVFEVRDVWPDALVDMGGIKKNSVVYYLFRFIEKLLYKKSARISSTLPNLREHVSKSGADSEKIVLIPNGIDLSAFTISLPKTKVVDNTFVIMYIGGFGLDHDVPTIIEAAKILRDSGDDRFRFIIIGGGVRKKMAVDLAKKYKLENMIFKDPIPKFDIPKVQNDADVLIASITKSDSYRFGLNLNKLCSYFASAKPVLFSGNPPNDPVKESGCGLSVDAESPVLMVEALKSLAAMSQDERICMGLRGLDYAQKNISMPILGTRMEKMLLEAIENHTVQ